MADRIVGPPLFLNSIGGMGSPWWPPGPFPAGLPDRHDRFLAAINALTTS